VKDPDGFGEYRQQVIPQIQRYGGKILVAAAEPDVKEGSWHPTLVIVEFESAEKAQSWYDCEEYQPLKALRQRCVEEDLVFVEGF
jgi:uncharacterized protein (DUF1330 family)